MWRWGLSSVEIRGGEVGSRYFYLIKVTFEVGVLFFFFLAAHPFRGLRLLFMNNSTRALNFQFFYYKIGFMVLFTHLKIILLQYFQFSISAK